MDRVETLRLEALNFMYNSDEFFYHFYKKYASGTSNVDYENYADAFDCAFSSLIPIISDGELIVGKVKNSLTESQKEEWKNKYEAIARERYWKAGRGQSSHMAIDYDYVLSRGIKGIIEDIERYEKGAKGEKAQFYSASKICLLAVVKHSENYARQASELAEKEENVCRKQELLRIAQICKKVPYNPAESFYEAVQSVHFITYCLSYNPLRFGCHQFQLGRPDKYLWKYYESDIKNGKITKEQAQLLLDCMAIQINNRVQNGLSCGYMVGGRDKNGEIIANELTGMLMQVIEDVRLVYPAVGLCYTSETPEKYLKKACEILSHGRSHPAIFNDDIITKGLISYGVTKEEAHDYIHSTCVEITPIGSSNVWVASPYTNMVQLLLDTMDREYESYEEQLSRLFADLDERIKKNFIEENETRKVRAEYCMYPLLSCFVDDCLKRGVDIERGGARYNWIMPSFIGMANLVDSLYVLKKIVYEEKRLNVCEFKRILDANFDGYEELRRYINDLPKYGNDIDEVDCIFSEISEHIVSECAKYTAIHSHGKIIPSIFCWIRHASFGSITEATPDGRLAGFPLGDGSGPCQGRERKGPTASILSSTKWDHHKFIGGIAVNMKFSQSTLGENSRLTMESLVKAFMIRGGFEIQINVTDQEVLKKAIENPAEYRDLLVRIGGYSDYFTKLTPEMQNEVMLRTEHEI